jgi:hypothetical protein
MNATIITITTGHDEYGFWAKCFKPMALITGCADPINAAKLCAFRVAKVERKVVTQITNHPGDTHTARLESDPPLEGEPA